MNMNTFHGNVGRDPRLHNSDKGIAATFSLAVSDGYFDRTRGQWVERPTVWHEVVVFGDQAANVHATITRGMGVTVTGSFSDNSYTPTGSTETVHRIRLVATEVAVSLRSARAVVTKVGRDRSTPATPADAAAPASA